MSYVLPLVLIIKKIGTDELVLEYFYIMNAQYYSRVASIRRSYYIYIYMTSIRACSNLLVVGQLNACQIKKRWLQLLRST